LHLGLNSDGTMQVPPLFAKPSPAAWYEYSPTPGQVGPSVIEGHIDSYQGPSVFYRLGAMHPGEAVDVTLADGTLAIFRATAVREYLKSGFPTQTVYGPVNYAALRLITCGGDFDYATHSYLSSTVVFASLVSSHRLYRSGRPCTARHCRYASHGGGDRGFTRSRGLPLRPAQACAAGCQHR
jgi:hypothetical protein